MIPPGPMRRRLASRGRPALRGRRGLPLLQRLQVLLTFMLLLTASVTAARYFTAQQLAYRATIIINVPAAKQGEEI